MTEWQPIETAPKDGHEVIAWSARDGAFVAFWHSKHKSWLWTTHDLCGDQAINPTHWMPLPEPPNA